MPVKTLHLTNSWHETSGGIATFYRALMEQANRRGHCIRLVVPDKTDWVEQVGEFGKIYHVEAPAAPLNPTYRAIYPSQYLGAGSKLQNILAAERPDLVEICDKYTLNYFAALLRKRLLPAIEFRPTVVGLSCERMDDNFHSYLGRFPFAESFCSTYMKWLYFPFFDHHIANSNYTASELVTAAQGQMVTRGTWVLPMGADLSQFSPQRRSIDFRQRLLQNFGADSSCRLLLYVGRLAPEKNLGLLFGALSDLVDRGSDYRLLVVGDGVERARWERESDKKCPGRALFLGHIRERNVLADLYANSDVFVHPNSREPFGIAPLEAMASGLPLVAPNRGGVTSYANAQNAWTVAPTVEDFAAAIEGVTKDAALREQKATNALATAQEYSWDKIASRFLVLYSTLATQREIEALPAASFYSTGAQGLRAMMIDGISKVAEQAFRLYARSPRAPELVPQPGRSKRNLAAIKSN